MPVPLGYTQSSGSNVLQSNPNPLAFSVIGDPTPAATYYRLEGMKRAMFPYKFPPYPGPTGPLRGAQGGA
jgi:hypothetical protein